MVVTGGKVHVREATVDGREFRVELQFFKTRHQGAVWNAVGRDPAGNIYLGNSTWGTNAYLYRLTPKTGRMRFVSDLLSKVRFGGPGGLDNGKIHSSFIDGPDGCQYFLSHCSWSSDIRYGGHLWKYDPKADRIIDLGVPVPGNTNFCLTPIDQKRGCSYMMSTSSGVFVRYDYASDSYTAIEWTGMNYVRHMPMDKAGNLHVFWNNRVYKFDPRVGTWRTIIRHGTTPGEGVMFDPVKDFSPSTSYVWGRDRKRLYFLNYKAGSAFSWDVGSPTVKPLGRMHPDKDTDLYLTNVHLSADQKRLYSIGATDRKTNKGVYMRDLVSGTSHKLCAIDDIIAHECEGKLPSERIILYFCDFGGTVGDDGTMYVGMHGGGRFKDDERDGKWLVALVAIRVTAEGEKAKARPKPEFPAPIAPVRWPAAEMALAKREVGRQITNVGVVDSYRMAVRAADREV